MVLTAAQRRLVARRRASKKQPRDVEDLGTPDEMTELNPEQHPAAHKRGSSLARIAEDLFQGSRAEELPIVVFTGAVALALIAFTLNIHSVKFAMPSGVERQLGFLWAPNWTITFLVVLPLYLAILADGLKSWVQNWRPRLQTISEEPELKPTWRDRVETADFSFWSVLIVTIVIASVYNWFISYFFPLWTGEIGTLPVDWGRVAIVEQARVSLRSSIIFSGIVFFYDGFCAYLFFTGLVFLNTVIKDYVDIAKSWQSGLFESRGVEIEHLSLCVMKLVFRCAALGIAITVLMKLQSSYLVASEPNILNWLVHDARSFLNRGVAAGAGASGPQSAPGFFYSFFCLLAISGVYVSASMRIRWVLAKGRSGVHRNHLFEKWALMDATMAALGSHTS